MNVLVELGFRIKHPNLKVSNELKISDSVRSLKSNLLL